MLEKGINKFLSMQKIYKLFGKGANYLLFDTKEEGKPLELKKFMGGGKAL